MERYPLMRDLQENGVRGLTRYDDGVISRTREEYRCPPTPVALEVPPGLSRFGKDAVTAGAENGKVGKASVGKNDGVLRVAPGNPPRGFLGKEICSQSLSPQVIPYEVRRDRFPCPGSPAQVNAKKSPEKSFHGQFVFLPHRDDEWLRISSLQHYTRLLSCAP